MVPGVHADFDRQGRLIGFEIDLLDPDTCRPALRQRIEREGIEL